MISTKGKPLRFVTLAHEHIPLLLPIEHEAYPDPWTHGMFRQEIENGASQFFVMRVGRDLVGYGGFWLLLDEAHLTKLTITEPYRRQGLGIRLMRYLLRHAEMLGATAMRLEVRESNIAALRLYEKLGFEEVHRRKGYYAKTDETAIVMAKSFGNVSEAKG